MRAENSVTDAQCQNLLREWSAGQLTEAQTRQGIAALLITSGVAREVSREHQTWHYALSSGPQLSVDVEAEFEDLLYRRLTEAGEDAFFNLERAAQASVTGWARQTLRAARKSVLRNIHNRTVARQELVSPTGPADSSSGAGQGGHTPYAVHAFQSASAPGVLDDDPEVAQRMMLEEATHWLRSRAAHHRGIARTAAGATALRYAFNFPAAVRPDVHSRRRALPLLETDPRAAHRSARAMLACVVRHDGWRTEFEAADPELLSLWDDYSRAQLFELVSRDPAIAQTLAVEALADRARPDRTALRAFRAAVRGMLPAGRNGRKPTGWRACADAVCDAYLAEEFEPFSAFDTSGADGHVEKVAAREAAVVQAWDDYESAVRFPGSPLGAAHQQVRETLETTMRGILGGGVQIAGASTVVEQAAAVQSAAVPAIGAGAVRGAPVAVRSGQGTTAVRRLASAS